MLHNSIIKLTGVAILLLLYTACNPGVKAVPIPDHTNLSPIENTSSHQFEPIGFEKAIVALKRGESIGVLRAGFSEDGNFCNFPNGSELTWAEGTKIISGRDDEIAGIFYDVLNEQGYNVVGDPTIVFNREENLSNAKYRVAAKINKITANICHEADSWDGRPLGITSGEIYINIEWSIYSNISKNTELRTSTSGYSQIIHGVKGGDAVMFLNAFANAAENLSATQSFHDLVLKSNVEQSPKRPISVLKNSFRRQSQKLTSPSSWP